MDTQNGSPLLSESVLSKYINAEDALKRLGGNAGLYKKLLQSFLSKNDLELLRSQLEENDIAAAAMTAHSIKGVSANLSLTELSTISATLEKQLKENSPHQDSFSELQEVMKTTIDCINQSLTQL